MKQKKFLAALLTIVATIFLVACGAGKTATKTADFQSITQNQRDFRNHFEYQGDKVVKMKTTATILYSAYGIDSKEAAQSLMKSQGAEEWDNLKGVDHKVDYKSDRLVETTSIDLEKVDFKKLGELMPIETADGKQAQYISYKLTKEQQKELGMKEVKDGKFEELK